MGWIFLDSDPAGLACHKPGIVEADDLRAWLFGQKGSPARVVLSEVIDYEVRRELIRLKARDSIRRLDNLYADGVVHRLPIDFRALCKAAELWATARDQGQQTADDQALDGDVILAAQALEFCSPADDWIILTENVRHIARYVGDRARSRREIVNEWLRSPRSLI